MDGDIDDVIVMNSIISSCISYSHQIEHEIVQLLVLVQYYSAA
jgi:hypothetical protein